MDVPETVRGRTIYGARESRRGTDVDRGRQRVLLVLAVVGVIGWLMVTRSVAAYLATTAVVGLVALRTSRWLTDREESHRTGREGAYAPPPATQWPDGL